MWTSATWADWTAPSAPPARAGSCSPALISASAVQTVAVSDGVKAIIEDVLTVAPPSQKRTADEVGGQLDFLVFPDSGLISGRSSAVGRPFNALILRSSR